MIVRVRVLVAVTCVVAFFSYVFGHQPRICSSSVWGNVNGAPSPVPYHAVVGPGVVKWKVYLPEVCIYGAVGTMVIACDTDEGPDVTFFNQSTVYIKRSGNVWIPGSVDVKVFCQKSKPVPKEPSNPEGSKSGESGKRVEPWKTLFL